MKHRSFLFLTTILVLLGLCGCGEKEAPSLPDPIGSYQNAVSAPADAQDITLKTTITKTVTSANVTYATVTRQTICYQDTTSDAFRAQVKSTLKSGNREIQFEEQYARDTAYLTIDATNFSSRMSGEDFRKRYIPVNFITPENYGSVTSVIADSCSFIYFNEANAPESWLNETCDTLLDAKGTVALDKEGNLLYGTYDITYSAGSATVVSGYHVSVDTASQGDWTTPDADSCLSISYIGAPYILELSSEFLTQASRISSKSTEQLTCMAGGISRKEVTDIRISYKDLYVDTQVDTTDQRRAGDSAFTQSEQFVDGKYSITRDGIADTDAPAVSQSEMSAYCRDMLVSSIPLPAYITNATLIRQEGYLMLELTGSEALAEAICADACFTLYQDADFLHNRAESYTTGTITAYVRIDEQTLLPVSSGYYYSGTHTIEGKAYKLTAQLDQTYSLPTE